MPTEPGMRQGRGDIMIATGIGAIVFAILFVATAQRASYDETEPAPVIETEEQNVDGLRNL
ncbi:hypothetical protein BMAGN_0717 [Bifidobacterium magnum]|uniref:Uncharacterized protein n=2 Tax=Bifidobacterium magnum TaxID=1692 RepID=A0A087BCU0_9BIFI|nr:hypothetical protein BMAGN_0717 [Bifidobacterium magnum]